MDYFPIFLNIKDQRCLVVGAGEVAFRKATMLAKAGAKLTVVAPERCASFDALTEIQFIPEHFQVQQLEGVALVIAATNDKSVNHLVSAAAKFRNIPVNVVDDPAACSFIMPSILDRSPLMVAFSTGGTSPVLARTLRAKLESVIPEGYGCLARFVERFRQPVKVRITDTAQRRIFWEEVIDGQVAEKVLAGDEAGAESLLQQQMQTDSQTLGEVFLVGAGPGDPDLLTFRALRLMQKADVVLYDNLVSQPIVEMTRRDAERIYVGKQRDNHTLPQEEINHMLVRLAKEGKRVLRLKGGDPFIFGRGG
ncbi:MAG: siroheme synthase, partial [Sideroxydans sp.]|nr:siroheme synthase [Sideroxydans sp.]